MSELDKVKGLIKEVVSDFENDYKDRLERLEKAEKGVSTESVGELKETIAKMDDNFNEIHKSIDALNIQIKNAGETNDAVDTLDADYAVIYGKKLLKEKSLSAGEQKIVDDYRVKTFAVGDANNEDGGHLVPTQNATEIMKQVEESVPLFGMARVVNSTLDNPEYLIQNAKGSTTHGDETTEVTDTNTPKVQTIRVPTWHFEAEPWITRQLLEDSAIDVAAFIQADVVEALSDDLGDQLINGDGTTEPKGILTAGNATSTYAQVGEITATDGDTTNFGFDLDDMFDVIYAVDRRYKNGTLSWLVGDTMMKNMRKIRDANGQYLWQPSLQVGEPTSFDGDAVKFTPYMPAVATGADLAIYGNFNKGYIIVNRPGGMFTLVDPITNKKYVKYYHKIRVGASIFDGRALRILKAATIV